MFAFGEFHQEEKSGRSLLRKNSFLARPALSFILGIRQATRSQTYSLAYWRCRYGTNPAAVSKRKYFSI